MTLEEVREAIRARPYMEDSIFFAWASAITTHIAQHAEMFAKLRELAEDLRLGDFDNVQLKAFSSKMLALLGAQPAGHGHD
jgi:hypothetical protein